MRLMDITRLRLPNSAGPKMRAPRMRKINVNAAPKSVPMPAYDVLKKNSAV
jgi:hypothetical protein